MDPSLVQELTDKIVRLQNLNLERHIRTLENTLGKCLSVDVIVLPYESYDVFEMSLERYIDGYQVSLVGNRTTKCFIFESYEEAKNFYDMKVMELTQIFKD